jgi:ABC-type polysaccharide/polyol phosphate transport system ATPase subunit
MTAQIKLDKVSLSIPLFLQQERSASNWASIFMGALFDPPRRRLAHVLHDVSFEANDGDRIALLGQNGAGKSTLLKVLNGIYVPTSGTMTMRGRRQSLLNMSLGFNPEASVRENIFLRGTAIGLDTEFLRGQIEPILDFAGLEEKDNHRLRTLSAGQRMRLGFSISTSVRQDILLMDEWVGASDANFMAKAKERLIDHAMGSSIVILATHTVGLLREICNKGLVMDAGRVVFFGGLEDALKAYQRILAGQWASLAPGQADERSGKHIYGYVDKVWLAGGKLHLKGWATSAEGTHPSHLAIRTGGVSRAIATLQRLNRPDVMQRFGLADAKCGFVASLAMPGVESLEELGEDFAVLAGEDAASATTALRLAPAVELQLQAESPT